MDVKESVQNQFGAAAESYAASRPHVDGPDLRALIAALPTDANHRVLDVGSGAGHTSFAFAASGAEVVAADLTEAMLEQTRIGAAERRLTRLSAERADAEALPFADSSFDVVTCRVAAHHFPHVDTFVSEMFRVVKPGGRIGVSDTVSPENDTLDTYLNAIEVLRDPSHVRNHRLSEWLGMFESAGFEDASVQGSYACPLDFDDWTQRMNTPEDACTGLRALFRGAPSEARTEFCLDPEANSWKLDIAVVTARKPLN